MGRSLSGRQLRAGKKGAMPSAKPGVVKAQSGWYRETVKVFRRKVSHRQADITLNQVRVSRPKNRPWQKPERVIADRGYNSDPLRKRWKLQGIELIAPSGRTTRRGHMKTGENCDATNDAGRLNDNPWLGQFRRVLVRHDHLLTVYLAFFHLACLWITLRKCF